MENLYPLFAVLAALAAIAIGAGEIIFLQLRPAAALTWLAGWVFAMSLIFSSTWSSLWSVTFAVLLSVGYVIGVIKLWGTPEK